jgi:hypothetical protein
MIGKDLAFEMLPEPQLIVRCTEKSINTHGTKKSSSISN